ncbi:DUF3422 domain-containing protein [Dechloromonas sp. XY25]|uniref:DUF3422 domain-containing protein n=1 Tax=Dechloromonas hankyongensis TaxID=2908002 RepID=A0ABS9JZM5_9RHOO|nr:DUF3422 domain-containing protein [Dechloromonas hankyongensis]MCG2576363.1 DUF3422 domain-containing protein [Dechloromonas hankyongensis]
MLCLAAPLNHPLRLALASEIHARPFMVLEAPARISHLAIHTDGGEAAHDQLLATLCARFGVAPPAAGAQYFFHDFGHFRLKWERHSEFSTFSFVEAGEEGGDFAFTALRHVPADWLATLHGSVIVASHIITERGAPLAIADWRLKRLFPLPPLVGSQVLSGGEMWTDFQVGPDGFSKFLIRDTDLRESQMGRLVQRLCEIETYLMMALLALPLARESAVLLGRIEEDLTELGSRMSSLDIDGDAEGLLRDIARLDAQVRAQSFRTGYRFSAAQAYYRIVGARIGELREKRIEGVPTIGEFMERRLAPAMDTCLSVAARQEALAARISRSNDMLRTRVNLAQERQTQGVLESLNRSAQRQLQLQQAVEGLSVVAISYYGIGLAGYALKALKGWGFAIPVDQVSGLLLPLIAGATWLGIRRLHKRLHP